MTTSGAHLEHLDEAAEAVRALSPLRPHVGLVLGSGLGAFAQTVAGAVALPFGRVPHFPVSTAIGHKGELVVGTCGEVPVVVLSGRVHHYEGYSYQQVVFPVRVLARLGVRLVVLTNAAGAVNTGYAPGDLMVLADHLNLTGGNPLIGPNEDRLGPRFPDLSTAYDPQLRAAAARACAAAGLRSHQGVYAALAGPSYETPAEIRMLRTLGADAVGMSTVPETIAARHAGLRVLGLSCITNMAAGVAQQALHHQEVLDVTEQIKPRLLDALRRLVAECARLA